jgi:hypothetical protein
MEVLADAAPIAGAEFQMASSGFHGFASCGSGRSGCWRDFRIAAFSCEHGDPLLPKIWTLPTIVAIASTGAMEAAR